MFKRNISVDDVKFALVNGELIVTYVNDKPFPSYLLLAYVGNRPIHILTGKDETLERCIIITAYEPDESIWEIGFKLKKK